MSQRNKNKVDAVLDEVIESKRVRQASIGLLKLLRLLSLSALPLFIYIAVTEPVDAVTSSFLASISLVIFLIVNKLINKA